MSDAHVKHLELIQGVVNRLAGNSFAMKGWAVAIAAALFALGTKDAYPGFVLAALLPTTAFWLLDAYYLRQERLFRALYDYVRQQDDDAWESERFCMKTSRFAGDVASWPATAASGTIAGFYVPLGVVILGVVLLQYLLLVMSAFGRCH